MPAETADVSLTEWLLAILPILLLVGLVLARRGSTGIKAATTTVVALLVAAVAFGAGTEVLTVAVGKGIWTGLWILYVIWTALLLYRVSARVGMDRMGGVLSRVLPRDVENVLLVAWIFPSFVQGVAGFGTPIAMAAPLLVSMGLSPTRAVVLPLIGYHWSVTFGSMGSSFYMGALTAGLPPASTEVFAVDAALILGVNAVVSGALVAALHGGWAAVRDAGRLLLIAGPAMAVTLQVAVRIEPAIGSLAAGAAGLATVAALRSSGRRGAAMEERRNDDTEQGHVSGHAPPPERPAVVLLPYAYLLVTVLIVFLPSASRDFVQSEWLLAPSFPATATAEGFANEAVDDYTPIAVLGHPGSYILLAALLGMATYRATGLWPSGSLGATLRAWLGEARRSTFSVVALTTLATVLVDAGMVRTIAVGAAEVTGAAFPAVAPVIGALGSFATGSTTTSNALFSALQRDVALLIDVGPPELLAAQTAGGNVGNSLAPVIILVGASAIGAAERIGDIFRAVVAPAAALLAIVVAMTFLLVALR